MTTDGDRAARADILMMAELAKFPYRPFDEDFTVHRYWQIEDKDAFFAEHGARIRGMVAAGRTKIDASILDRLPRLEFIANIGVGYDRLDIGEVASRGIVASNTPDVLTDEVADLTLGLLLATVRRLPQAERHLREGRWLSGTFPNSPSLRDRRVGILGLGRIGKAIARRVSAFDVEVVYCGRTRQEDVPYPYYASLAEMARDVDVLILALPGGPETVGLVDAAVLEALGPDGILVNIARGSVVDREALIDALQHRKILAAGLDVYWEEPKVPEELLALDNVVLLPHVGSASLRTRTVMIELVRRNLASWFEGKGPVTPVPETPWSALSPA